MENSVGKGTGGFLGWDRVMGFLLCQGGYRGEVCCRQEGRASFFPSIDWWDSFVVNIGRAGGAVIGWEDGFGLAFVGAG